MTIVHFTYEELHGQLADARGEIEHRMSAVLAARQRLQAAPKEQLSLGSQ